AFARQPAILSPYTTLFRSPFTQRCCIAIADRGPGLTKEQAPQIGRRFWRGDQGRHRKNGAGLGISIVHAIAERFGGKLRFESRRSEEHTSELQSRENIVCR